MWDKHLNNLDKTDIPNQFAAIWNGDPKSIQVINLGINAVFKFKIKDQNYYLRITHKDLRPLEKLAAAIDFQSHLFNEGAPVCQPIPSDNNAFIEFLDPYLGHVSAEVQGNPINLKLDDPDIYYNWGQALAGLHKASQTYVPPEDFTFNNWQDLLTETGKYLSKEKDLQPHYDRLYEWVSNLPQGPGQYGLIHADHRDANVIYTGITVGIIDFDEPDYHWYMMDIMRPFLEVSLQPKKEWRPQFTHYIKGYQSIQPIDPILLKQSHHFIQLKALEMYLWMKNNWAGDEIPGGGNKTEWLSMLMNIVTSKIINFE